MANYKRAALFIMRNLFIVLVAMETSKVTKNFLDLQYAYIMSDKKEEEEESSAFTQYIESGLYIYSSSH